MDIRLRTGSISQNLFSNSRNQKPPKPPCYSRKDFQQSASGEDDSNNRGISTYLLATILLTDLLGLTTICDFHQLWSVFSFNPRIVFFSWKFWGIDEIWVLKWLIIKILRFCSMIVLFNLSLCKTPNRDQEHFLLGNISGSWCICK